jgi:hypothetical protein
MLHASMQAPQSLRRMNMHRTMVICLRGIFACALLAVMMIALQQPSVARDRPGAPKAITADNCSPDPFDYLPRICGTFTVTATEDNRTEVEITRNGAPFPLNAKQVFCPNQRVNCWDFTAVFRNTGREVHPVAPAAGVQGSTSFITQVGETVVPYGWKDLDFGTQYCFHFRARRTSDQVVSEIWSAWACARTPDKPSLPVLPEYSVSFSGTQMLNKPATATPGATAQVIPEKMEIRYPEQQTNAAYVYVFVYPPGVSIVPWKPGEGSPGSSLFFSQHLPTSFTDEFKIPDNLTAAVVQICGGNIAGQKCATKNVSIINSDEIELPRTSAPVVRPTGAPAIKPVRPTGRPETAPAPVATAPARIDQSFMAGTDLPGGDYRNAALDDNNATTCKTMCGTDAKCLSWTWVKPGVQNAKAMCWLKNAVPPSHPNPNVTSGIKVTNGVIH